MAVQQNLRHKSLKISFTESNTLVCQEPIHSIHGPPVCFLVMGRLLNLYGPNRIYTSPMVVKMSIVGFDYVLQGSALCNIANGVGFYTHRFVGMFLGDFNKC